MKKLFFILTFIILISIALAQSYTPPSDINGRNVRSIYGMIWINATNFCTGPGECVSDFSSLGGSSTSGWNITESKYLINDSNILDVDETVLNATINSLDTDTQLSQEQVEDYVGGMTSGTETHISVTYNDAGGNLNYVVSDDWYNSISDLPTAAVSNGDTTHVSTSDAIYDFVIGLGYLSSVAYTDLTGNPSDVITAGSHLSWSTDTLNVADDWYNSASDVIGGFSGTCDSSTFLRADGACQTPAGGSFTNGSAITVSSIHIENPPTECNINNSFMTQFGGNSSTCRELNQSIINTADLNNDAGFITSTLSESQVEAMIFDSDNTGTLVTSGNLGATELYVSGGSFIGGNSTCMILYSPDTETTLEVCN